MKAERQISDKLLVILRIEPMTACLFDVQPDRAQRRHWPEIEAAGRRLITKRKSGHSRARIQFLA